jgi:hypothetical protein
MPTQQLRRFSENDIKNQNHGADVVVKADTHPKHLSGYQFLRFFGS